MKTPTITKQQSIAALVELKRRDYIAALKEFTDEQERLTKEFEDEVKRALVDPIRMTTIINTQLTVTGYRGPEIEDCVDINTLENISINFTPDEKIRNAWYAKTGHDTTRPVFNESEVTRYLEDKLTGCDPASLLSVPENVATFRALLNGLQLLPESYESLAQ